jgi:hypothetical protein
MISIWNISFSIGDKLYVFDEHKVSESRDDVIKYIMDNTLLADLREITTIDIEAITEPMNELLDKEDTPTTYDTDKDTRKNPFTRSD